MDWSLKAAPYKGGSPGALSALEQALEVAAGEGLRRSLGFGMVSTIGSIGYMVSRGAFG